MGQLALPVLSISGILQAHSPKSRRALMERWQLAFLKKDAAFKELFGVKKAIFLNMQAILTDVYHQRHRKGGRSAKLTLGDQLLLTLQYWREYRTMAHLAFDFGISKSTVSNTITLVENVLIQDGTFHLQGKKALFSKTNAGKTFVVDVTESPMARPKKNKRRGIRARKSGTR
jgi:hypothetical protein